MRVSFYSSNKIIRPIVKHETKSTSRYPCISILCSIFFLLLLASGYSVSDPIGWTLDAQGNVTWGGDTSDESPISDTAPPGGFLSFTWTRGEFDPDKKSAKPHPSYTGYAVFNTTNSGLSRQFFMPNDDTITDWFQIVIGKGTSKVYGGNISKESPWTFQPLNDLPDISWRIPDLAPFESDSNLTIYTAVNLDLYLNNNPLGFLDGNWLVGQTIDDLGISIVEGHIDGVEGIYFSTSDFTFEPDSALGWIPIEGSSAWLNSLDFQSDHGRIGILAEHQSIAEPASFLLLLMGMVGLLSVDKETRCRPQVKS